MKKNSNLTKAKEQKNDEFYTQYADIEKEINAYLERDKDVFRNKTIFLPCDDPEWSSFTLYFSQNFKRLGLKKLISTSYAGKINQDEKRGKLFILERDVNNDGNIDINDIEWTYLNGDGDFRSQEVDEIAKQSDFIITNPPFSLFREFLSLINKNKKKF